MNTAHEIEKRLQAVLKPAHLIVEDDSAAHAGHAGNRQGGGHYRVLVVSATFSGENRVNRQRLVQDALDGLFVQQIHALNIKALTPEEFQAA
ncbi:BolA family protein [Stenoxybacter acetivorans]|uniref:BolA family protein n=1 Tax=Stenoxybacter acetivorans TaxID=422441 RepID=UPI00056469DF|nr:BolA family protein [Stenoxybacter acetivorans]